MFTDGGYGVAVAQELVELLVRVQLPVATPMKFLSFVLNIPWILIGMAVAAVSFPRKICINSWAIIFEVKSFWWYTWLPKKKGVRAMAIGNAVLLGPNVLQNDLEHELIHVEQSMREPLIHPFLYWAETMRRGYRHNKYEEEAYSRSASVYIDK